MENNQNKTIGIYAGVWDFLHYGHLLALQMAKQHCDFLVIAINEDPTIDNPKKNKPIETITERLERLKACKYVDSIIIYKGEKELLQIYQRSKFDIAFISKEHTKKYTNCSPAKPFFLNKISTYSSSSLRERILDSVYGYTK